LLGAAQANHAGGEHGEPTTGDGHNADPHATGDGHDANPHGEGEGGHGHEVHGYEVFHVEFDRVEIPFIAGIWIFISSIAKIGNIFNSLSFPDFFF